MHERHAQQAIQLALADVESVEPELAEDGLARVVLGDQRDAGRDEDHGDGQPEPDRAAAPREVPVRGAGVAGLLGQPAESRGDLGLVLRGSPAIGLSIGIDGLVQIARADAHARKVPPSPIRGSVLGQGGHGLPRRGGARLVVHPVQRVARPEQRGAGDLGLGMARGAPEVGDGQLVLAGLERRAAACDEAAGNDLRERALRLERRVELRVAQRVEGCLVGLVHPAGRY